VFGWLLCANSNAKAVSFRGDEVTAAADDRFNRFLDEAFGRYLRRHPIRETRIGLKTHEDQWDDISDRAQLAEAAQTRNDLRVLHHFAYSRLSAASRLNYRLFERQAHDTLTRISWRRSEYLVTQMGGIHRSVPTTLINSHTIADRYDAEAYIIRLSHVAALMSQLVFELQRQERDNVRPPRFVYDLAIEQAGNLLKGQPLDDSVQDEVVLADFKRKVGRLDLEQRERDDLVRRATSALRTSLVPGYQLFIAHLRNARAAATNDAGVWKLPKGAAFYRHALESATTLPQDPEVLHAYGIQEVKRWQDELRKLMPALGKVGSLSEMLNYIRTDPRFLYGEGDGARARYLGDAGVLLAFARARQSEVLNRVPRTDVELKAVEPWREKSAARAFYQNPAADGSRPGIFYINLFDMSAAPRYQLAATLYHEAIPGHHIETAVAYELDNLPRFRKFSVIPAYSEGWSLYAEQLADELGWYADAEQRLGRISMALLRAARLVVDTGLHAKHWTREQATRYLDENTTGSSFDNAREVDRYIAEPGQATAYYVGMRYIVELRERAQHELGDRFDLRAFHDALLGSGPLPMSVLGARVAAWVEERRLSH